MITNFKVFGSADSDITYDEAIYLYELSEPIKKYFYEEYPDEDDKILGRYGHSITNNTAKNILKFAKNKKDKVLISLVQKHLDRLNDPNIRNSYKLDRDSKKYNI